MKIVLIVALLWAGHKWFYWRAVSMGLLYHIQTECGEDKMPSEQRIVHLAQLAIKKIMKLH